MLQLVTPPTAPTEPLVDAQTCANHFGFDVQFIRRMATSRAIPFIEFRNGARTYYRFRISEVEKALAVDVDHQKHPGSAKGKSTRKKGKATA